MIACRRLDFPLPTSPMMLMNSPFLTENFMSLSVTNFSSFFLSSYFSSSFASAVSVVWATFESLPFFFSFSFFFFSSSSFSLLVKPQEKLPKTSRQF